MARYRNTPQALLDQLKASQAQPTEPITPEPENDPAAPTPTQTDSTALALMITQACAKAGMDRPDAAANAAPVPISLRRVIMVFLPLVFV